MKFGFAIKHFRKIKPKYTQADLAEAIGVDRSYIGGLETDKRTPSLSTLIKIADNLDVSLRTLINLSMYQELYEKYTIESNNTRKILSDEEIDSIGSSEAFAFRDVFNETDIANLHNHLGDFLDKVELRTRQYESGSIATHSVEKNNIPSNEVDIASIINVGINKEKNILFKKQQLTDGQLLGMNQYLQAITNTIENGGANEDGAVQSN
ncbi:helix-turn-helix domain-containing protein [Vagococcus fluvialis]|uniref:helix-turn-helix domain-containing protein n=1 Tax=Vagococcus fluvialis TaxID=2738 RepID=UPI003B596097